MTNKQEQILSIIVGLIVFVLFYIWHYWKIESAWVNGACSGEGFGYHSVYGLCDEFKNVRYRKNGSSTWYEVPLGYYLKHQLKWDSPYYQWGIYKIVRELKYEN